MQIINYYDREVNTYIPKLMPSNWVTQAFRSVMTYLDAQLNQKWQQMWMNHSVVSLSIDEWLPQYSHIHQNPLAAETTVKLNPTKTEVLWLGSSHQLSQISITDIPLQSTMIRVAESACDLGVVTDSKLSLSAHVAALCRCGFYHLRQLHPVLRSLTHKAEH